MSLLVCGVTCDAVAHIDRRTVSDTVVFSLSKRKNSSITVFLFCDGDPFPISDQLTAECCIKNDSGKITASCYIGQTGEVIIPIPTELQKQGQSLSCEVNISGVDDDNLDFRYKAANFIVAITN